MQIKVNETFNNSALRTAGKLCFPVVLGVLISLTPGCGGGSTPPPPVKPDPLPTPELSYPTTFLHLRQGQAMVECRPNAAPWQGDLFTVTPALPEGLSLNPATGGLSGTPAAASEAGVYTITAFKNGQTASATLELLVLAANATTLTYPASTLLAPNGTPIIELRPLESWTGGTFTVSPDLPHGLVLDPATGILKGTPDAAPGAAVYQITVTRGHETATATLEITVAQGQVAPLRYPATQVTCAQGEALPPLSPQDNAWHGATFTVHPQLPAGLNLDPSTGTLYGTPEGASANRSYTITATRGHASASATLTLEVVAPGLAFLSYGQDRLAGTRGQLISPLRPLQDWAGGAFTAAPALPAGLSLDAATGVISGVPAAWRGPVTHTITVTRGAQTASTTLTITVAEAPLTYPANRVACAQGEPMAPVSPVGSAWSGATFTVSPQLPAGLSLAPDTGTLSGTPGEASPSQIYIITATLGHATNTAALTLEVLAPGQAFLTYTRDHLECLQHDAIHALRPMEDWTGGAFTVAPALPAGLSLDAATGVISGAPTVWRGPVTHTVTVTRGAQTATATLVIRVQAAAQNLSYPVSQVVFLQGQAIDPLRPEGGPWAGATFRVAPALPAGLSLDPATGVLSGTPTETLAAAALYRITADRGGVTSAAELAIRVKARPRVLAYPAPSLVLSRNGARVEFRPTGPAWTGTVFTVAPALPSGLDLDPATGAITGLPLEASAARTYTVTARQGQDVSSATFTLSVERGAGRVLAYPAATLELTKDVAMTAVQPTGGAWTGAAFTVTPALPAGLSLNLDNGTLSGTPTETSPAKAYTVTATEFGETSSTVLTLTVREAAPANLRYHQATARYPMGVPIPANTPLHDGGAVTAYTVAPDLPAGLTLDGTTGILSGTPTAAMPAAVYRVTARNSAGSTTAELTLEVLPASAVTINLNPYVTSGKAGSTATIADQGPGATYAWTLTGAAITAGADGPAVTFTPGAPGPLQATVAVTLPDGTPSQGLALATVVPAPSAAITVPDLAHPGDEHLRATVQDHPGLTYHWTLTPRTTGATLESDPAKAAVTLNTGAREGVFDLKVTVQNQAGDHEEKTTAVRVQRGVWVTKDEKGPAVNGDGPVSATPLPDGRILVVGGRFQLPHAPAGTLVTAAIHDPKANLWASTSLPLSEPFKDHTATLLGDGTIVVMGTGEANQTLVKSYHPDTNTWQTRTASAAPRRGHTATLLGDGHRVLVVGGESAQDDTPIGDTGIYDANTDTWAQVTPMAAGRASHTATRLENGTILVLGGIPNANTAEVYDPDTDVWQETTRTPRHADRAGHATCRLQDGTVLVVGGAGAGGARGHEAEIYDPRAETWTPTGSLAKGRVGHTATLLGSGKVLVAGGMGIDAAGTLTPLADAELFDPATGTWTSAGVQQSPRAYHAALPLGYDRVLTLLGDGAEVAAEQYMTPADAGAAPAGGGPAGGGPARGGGTPLRADNWNMADFITMELDPTRAYTQKEFMKAYRAVMLKWHPDRNADNRDEAMRRTQDIANAYSRLREHFQ